jgi:hypothetical protein
MRKCGLADWDSRLGEGLDRRVTGQRSVSRVPDQRLAS